MKYSKKTNDYIKAAQEHLENTYGEVKSEWVITLQMMKDNIELYQRVLNEIDTYGIYNAQTGLKNPLLSTAKDLQASLMKMTQKLGLTPYDAAKIKQTTEDDTEDFIDRMLTDE